MPELPEVETTIRSLRKKVLNRTFVDFWTDFPKNIKRPRPLKSFVKEIRGKKILKIWRRGKNILFSVSGEKVLLIHQKLTGHLLLGKWRNEGGRWESEIPGAFSQDPKNGFIHLIFRLDNGFQLALSDLRKFAKIELWGEKELAASKDFESLGPDPLDAGFSFKKFKNVLPKSGKIKQVLMDQQVLAGIGNIYSDEILWEARVNPLKDVSKLSEGDLENIFTATKKVLRRAIKLKGDSFSDYRLINGGEGRYQKVQNVYGREGNLCHRNDGGIIQRVKIGGRSAHFCPKCQKF